MIPIQTFLVRTAPTIGRNMVQTRNITKSSGIVSAPARIRVSFQEKAVHGLLIAVGLLATPAWILVHMKDYSKGAD